MSSKGFANIAILVIVLLAVAGVGYVAFVERFAAPAMPLSPAASSPSASVDAGANWRTMQWETYKHGEAGLEFSYPPFPLYYMPPMQEYEEKDLRANQPIAGYIHFNMWPIGAEESIPSRRETFSQLARKSQGEECDDLRINTSLFGTDSIARSCRVFISDYGTPMITGFYRNEPGDVIFMAFFRGSKSEGVLSMSLDPNFPSEEIKQMPELFAHPVRAEEIVRRIAQGEFPGITDELAMFKAVLKTVKVSEPSASVDTSNWKTYRNDEVGLEFRYPAEMNGKTVTPTVQPASQSTLALKLYSSAIPFAPSYPPESGIRGAPSLHNVLGVQVVDLKRPPHYFSTGHFGGFEYNPGRDRWRETDGEGGYVRELTWDSFLTAVSAKPFGRDIFLVTATSPAGGGDYINDPRTRYYYLMNREQKKYAVVQHFAFADISPTAVQDSIRAQFNVEADTVSDIARQMLDTLTFLPRAPEGSPVVPMPSAVPSSAAPTIRAIVPSSGPVGTQVMITGSGFTATHNTVKLMDSTGVFTADQVIDLASGNSTLTFVLPNIPTSGLCVDPAPNPPPGSGPYGCFQLNPRKVVVANAHGNSNGVNFEITAGNLFPPITITNIVPASGSIGARVTLAGSGFAPTGNHVVFRNATMIAYVSSIPSSDGSSITFTVPTSGSLTSGLTPGNPSSLLPGLYTLTVSNSNRTDSSNSVDFTVTASP